MAASIVLMPRNRNALTRRARYTPWLRSTRPLACGELAPDDREAQLLAGHAERRHRPLAGQLLLSRRRSIRDVDGLAVPVQGRRNPVAFDPRPQHPLRGLGRLVGMHPRKCRSGRIVHQVHQTGLRPRPKPVVVTAVHLPELATSRPPQPSPTAPDTPQCRTLSPPPRGPGSISAHVLRAAAPAHRPAGTAATPASPVGLTSPTAPPPPSGATVGGIPVERSWGHCQRVTTQERTAP